MTRGLQNKARTNSKKNISARQNKAKVKESASRTVASRIKNPELVRKKHLHIAKKAAKLFIKKGYHQTTMREISRATGMAIGNLYGYITHKEDVLCLAFDAFHQYGRQHLDARADIDTGNPEELLRSFVHGALQSVRKFREEIILMYRESRMLPKKELRRSQEKEMAQIKALARVLERGMDEGLFRPQDPFFAAGMVFYQLIFLTIRGWMFAGKYSAEETEALLEDCIINLIIIPKAKDFQAEKS